MSSFHRLRYSWDNLVKHSIDDIKNTLYKANLKLIKLFKCKKYRVNYAINLINEIEVEANSKEEAKKKVREMIDDVSSLELSKMKVYKKLVWIK